MDEPFVRLRRATADLTAAMIPSVILAHELQLRRHQAATFTWHAQSHQAETHMRCIRNRQNAPSLATG